MEKYFELVRVNGNPERPDRTKLGLIAADSIEEALAIARNSGLPTRYGPFSRGESPSYFYVTSDKGGYSSPEEANQSNEDFYRDMVKASHSPYHLRPSDLQAPPKLHVLTPSDLTTLRGGK